MGVESAARVKSSHLVAVTLVCLVAVGGAFYQPPTETPTSPYDPTPPDGGYATSERISVDGEVVALVEARRSTSPRSQKLTQRYTDVGYSKTAYHEGATTHVRLDTDNEDRLDYFTTSRYPDATVVERDRAALTAVVRIDGGDPPLEGVSTPTPNTATALRYPEYEFVERRTHRGEAVDAYRARGGWFSAETPNGETVTIRVADASGEVLVDAKTDRLVWANVSYRLVEAETWGGVALSRLADEDDRIRVGYSYDGSDASVERPDWAVDESR